MSTACDRVFFAKVSGRWKDATRWTSSAVSAAAPNCPPSKFAHPKNKRNAPDGSEMRDGYCRRRATLLLRDWRHAKTFLAAVSKGWTSHSRRRLLISERRQTSCPTSQPTPTSHHQWGAPAQAPTPPCRPSRPRRVGDGHHDARPRRAGRAHPSRIATRAFGWTATSSPIAPPPDRCWAYGVSLPKFRLSPPRRACMMLRRLEPSRSLGPLARATWQQL